MKSEHPIKQYNEFNEYYIDTNGLVRARHPNFHIFRFNELGDQVVTKQGSFKTAYYQFALGSSLDANVTVFDKSMVTEGFSLIIFVPGQVIEWERMGNWNGYVINVKESFINFSQIDQALERYQFLHNIRPLIFTLQREDYLILSRMYELMLAEHEILNEENLYVIRHLMHVLLVYLNRIIKRIDGNPSSDNEFTYAHDQEIATHFKRLVLANYLTHKSVSYYADTLNVTSTTLNKSVRHLYNKSPKQFINEVILLHAQAVLQHSDASIKELAYQLNFDDYSHFVKFFKGATSQTPAEYRKRKG